MVMPQRSRVLFLLFAIAAGITLIMLRPDPEQLAIDSLDSHGHVDELLRKYRRKTLPEIGTHQSEGYNIVVILTDDQNYRTVQHMPFLQQQITRTGTVFSNAFASNPTCCPFRASFISGGFDSHETGVKALTRPNGQLYNLDENRTIATYLQSAGIRTGFIGKYMHGYIPGYVPPGWDRFIANEDGGALPDYWNLNNITYGSSGAAAVRGDIRHVIDPLEQYISTFQTREAIEFIREFRSQRFFLLLSYYAPHTPHIQEQPGDYEYALSLPFACQPDSVLESKPLWVGVMARYMKQVLAENPEKYGSCAQNNFYGQVALLQSVDRGIREIFQTLEAFDLKDRTAIFFSSDNGVILGSKTLPSDKGMPYEDVIRVPLAAFVPGWPAQHREELVAVNLDLGATIFDLAGIDAPTEGQSLVDSIAGKSWRNNRLLIENYGYLDYRRSRGKIALPPVIWSGFRTPRWKYVEYTTGEVELYDLAADPAELENLSDRSIYTELIAGFHRDLAKEKGLAISTVNLPPAIIGDRYAYELAAWGGTPPYTWRADTALPVGLALDAPSGRLSGTPQAAGSFEVRFSVRDSGKTKHGLKPDHFSWPYTLRVCADRDHC